MITPPDPASTVTQSESNPPRPLPPDLYPLLISHISSLSLLSTLCQVDSIFLTLGRRKLYKSVWVRPWEGGGERKVRMLMRSLSESEEDVRAGGVASLVKELDIRFYPMAAGPTFEDTCVRALSKLTNLQSLIWTRDTTLTERMILALTSHSPPTSVPPTTPFINASTPQPTAHSTTFQTPPTTSTCSSLLKLEINGHLAYPPRLLHGFGNLKELKVVLPSREFVQGLEGFLKNLWEVGATSSDPSPDIVTSSREKPVATTTPARTSSTTGLTHLSLLHQSPRFITDSILLSLAPYLGNLRSFKLWGMAGVGPRGYLGVLRVARGLEELGLEGCGYGDEQDILDENLYLERESSLSIGIGLRNLRSLSVSESVFQRLLLADRSRQEQADVRRMLGRGLGDAPEDSNDFDTTPAPSHRDYPHLNPTTSFFPSTLESLHVTRQPNTTTSDERATPIISAACEMWPQLKRLWFTDYFLGVRDLELVVMGLRGLESLMVRMYESKPNPKLLAMYLSRLTSLRVFHLQSAERRPGIEGYTISDLTFIAQLCGPSLEQIGWANRVYAVKRRKVVDWEQDGVVSPRVRGWRVCTDAAGEGVEAGSACLTNVQSVEEIEEVYLEDWIPGVVPEAYQVWRG